MSTDDLSRRGALSGGAALLAGAGVALAVSAVGRDAQAQSAADVTALNNLLRAEYELRLVYANALDYFMNPGTDPHRTDLAPAAVLIAGLYRTQHIDHAARLSTLITSFQGTPIDLSAVSFMAPMGFTSSVKNYLRLACNKEKAAAVAYVNALKTLASDRAAELAAAIGGVETQHFIALYLLLQGVVTPGPAASMMIGELCPRSVVAITDDDPSGLASVSLPYMPLM